MCEVPRPRWRQAWRPARIALLVVATGCLVVGVVWHTRLGVVALAVGATLVFAAVLFPLVSEVEFGFPVGIKVKAGAREREHRMRKTFEDHRGDVELCAHLLCSPPEAAAALVEAAWARTAGAWRGAVTPELRAYVLCELVQLAGAHERWVSGPAEDSPASPLARLTPPQRVAVVLHDFGGVPAAQIATMTGRPVEAVTGDLRVATSALAAS